MLAQFLFDQFQGGKNRTLGAAGAKPRRADRYSLGQIGDFRRLRIGRAHLPGQHIRGGLAQERHHRVQHHLPGVFLSNSYAGAVNGSLWTMPYEVQMYGVLVVVGLLTYTPVRILTAQSILLLTALGALAMVTFNIYHYIDTQKMIYWPILGGMFFTGSLAYLLRHRIIMSSLFAVPMAISLFYYAAGWPPDNTYFVLYWLFLAYLTLYLSYVPRGPLLHFNKLGDYSYGMYIYAFPIQQSLISYFPDISADQLTYAALPLTLIASVFSWHLVEKKALALKNKSLLPPVVTTLWKKYAMKEPRGGKDSREV